MIDINFLFFSMVNSFIQMTIFFIMAVILSRFFMLDGNIIIRGLCAVLFSLIVFTVSAFFLWRYISPFIDEITYSSSSLFFIAMMKSAISIGVSISSGICFFRKISVR